jgi:hypothetical protein
MRLLLVSASPCCWLSRGGRSWGEHCLKQVVYRKGSVPVEAAGGIVSPANGNLQTTAANKRSARLDCLGCNSHLEEHDSPQLQSTGQATNIRHLRIGDISPSVAGLATWLIVEGTQRRTAPTQ